MSQRDIWLVTLAKMIHSHSSGTESKKDKKNPTISDRVKTFDSL